MRKLSSVLVLLLAAPMLAQSTDYAVRLQGTVDFTRPAMRVAVGQPVYYQLVWEASGPIDPERVVIELDLPGSAPRVHGGFGLSCIAGDPVRCTLDSAAGQSGVRYIEARSDGPGLHTATARVIHLDGHADPNPANDQATHTVEAVALPSVQLTPNVQLVRVEPGAPGVFLVDVQNHGSIPATNVVLTISLPAGGTITGAETKSGSATCGGANDALVCTTPALLQDELLRVEVSISAPARLDGADLVILMSVTSAEEDFQPADNQTRRNVSMVRQFIVANVEDEGSGSLRQAMFDANAFCAAPQPCAILFRIPPPVPAAGWFTIQPRTPLPAVTGTLKLDGRTQTLFTGDTNPDGPEIEINGALAGSEAGLRLRPSCDMQISNLAVNGFPGFGIKIEQAEPAPCAPEAALLGVVVRQNYLGTDPRGRVAKPNHRGLGLYSQWASVHDNVISGNRRAGIYATAGSSYDISGNRIGIGTDGSPLGNGAGIFLDLSFPIFDGFSSAYIRQNVIAYNDGMAVARTRRGHIFISRNSIFDNLQQGIDVDVDGPTAQRPNDRDVPNAPILFSAAYDPAQDATIVRGRIDSEMFASVRNVELYASTRLSVWATPQAEQWVATQQLQSGHESFEIAVPGDWRGKWITATYNGLIFNSFVRNPGGIGTQADQDLYPADTSELSNAVMAQ